MFDHTLRIRVEQKTSYDERHDQLNSHKQGQSIQTLERVITLPFTIPKQEIKATLEHSVLSIVIPKKEINQHIIHITESS